MYSSYLICFDTNFLLTPEITPTTVLAGSPEHVVESCLRDVALHFHSCNLTQQFVSAGKWFAAATTGADFGPLFRLGHKNRNLAAPRQMLLSRWERERGDRSIHLVMNLCEVCEMLHRLCRPEKSIKITKILDASIPPLPPNHLNLSQIIILGPKHHSNTQFCWYEFNH